MCGRIQIVMTPLLTCRLVALDLPVDGTDSSLLSVTTNGGTSMPTANLARCTNAKANIEQCWCCASSNRVDPPFSSTTRTHAYRDDEAWHMRCVRCVTVLTCRMCVRCHANAVGGLFLLTKLTLCVQAAAPQQRTLILIDSWQLNTLSSGTSIFASLS